MTQLTRTLTLAALALLAATSAARSEITVEGSRCLMADADKSSGLATVVVVEDAPGATLVWHPAKASAKVEWARFGHAGAAYAEPVAPTTALTLRISSAEDAGYVVTEDGRPYYFWLTNYANHRFAGGELTVNSGDSDCSRLTLHFSGNGAPVRYYSVNGRQLELSRDLKVEYSTLNADNQAVNFVQADTVVTLGSIQNTLIIDQPLCPTQVSLSGDRFLEAWGAPVVCTSDAVTPTAVSAIAVARNVSDERPDNQISTDIELGGSAPVEIALEAAVTDAAIFHEWQLSRSSTFDPIDNRYTDLAMTLTVNDAGTTFVRFVAANADASCTYESDPFTIFVGESRLEVPNAFSPLDQNGVNDIWKVSYQSIVSFSCAIFNRWGVEIASFTDPSQGWDGTYKGKLVPAGVYFYAIKARGADGRNWDCGGDINIVGTSQPRINTSSSNQ